MRIYLLLLDKSFYSSEVIRKMKSMGVKFFIAVSRNSRVKKVIMDYYRTGEDRVRRPLVKVKEFSLDFGYFVLSAYGLGPP